MSIFLELKENYGTQLLAAEALGVADSTFSDWKSGRCVPKSKNILKLMAHGFTEQQIFAVYIEKKSAPTSLENNHG